MPAVATRTKKSAGSAGKLPDVKVEARPVLYAELAVNGVPIPTDKLRIGFDRAKALLGAETEREYKARMEKSSDPTERAKGVAGFGDEYLFVDANEDKVRCRNNADNRPWDLKTSDGYAQDTLNREWAGYEMGGQQTVTLPLAGPDGRPSGKTVDLPLFTVNGETVIIGRTGKVESGQHRLVGVYLAHQRWEREPHLYPLWTEAPFIESLVVTGVSESERVVATLDNVRPRQLSDIIATSAIFKYGDDGKELPKAQRQLLSRMLDTAVDTVWRRTGAGVADDPTRKRQTHSTSLQFLERHGGPKGRLCQAVKAIYNANKSNGLGVFQLSPGQCAGALYLMGADTSDPAGYAKDRTEKALKWDHWKKANDFFLALSKVNLNDAGKATSGDRWAQVVVEKLGSLHSVEPGGAGLGGRMTEKLAVLAAAWKRFRNDQTVRPDDLKLHYGTTAGGAYVLLDPPLFGGIDLGDAPDPPEKETPKEVEQRVAEEKADRAEAVLAAERKAGGATFADVVEQVRADHANAVLFFADPAGDYNVYGEDADTLGRELATAVHKGVGGVHTVVIPRAQFETVVRQLMGDGYNLKTVALTDGEVTVTEVKPRKKGAAAEPAGLPSVAQEQEAAKAEKAAAKAAKPAAPKKKSGPKLKGGTEK